MESVKADFQQFSSITFKIYFGDVVFVAKGNHGKIWGSLVSSCTTKWQWGLAILVVFFFSPLILSKSETSPEAI